MSQSVQDAQSLPKLPTPGVINALQQESRLKRVICFTIACLLAAGFFWSCMRSWVPVHGGVDQNGYLVGGRMIAEHGSMAYTPRNPVTGAIDPFQFIGRMWVAFDLGTPAERYLPKYPVGLPLLYAGALKPAGVAGAYLVSPIAMTLSLLGTFLMGRLLLGSVPSLAVMVLVGTSPVSLTLATNPNSHAVSLFLVAWGMFFVVRWWLVGGWSSAILGGLLVGSAVSIRYTEGMLILPLALAGLFRLSQGRWRERGCWLQIGTLMLAWAVPVIALLWHNRLTMHAWTGYDPTNESTGFAWRYFVENWDTMLRQMYQMGFTLIFPMAIGGMAAGFVWNWRIATFLASWIVPCLLLYTAYYWAPETLNIGYTRFFLTIFPAMGICAFGLLLWPVTHLPAADDLIKRRLKRGAVLALSLVTVLSVALGIANCVQTLQADHASRQNLDYRTTHVLSEVPAGSILISDDMNLLHHVQLAGDYTLYSPEVFNRLAIDRMASRDPDQPQGLDPGRAEYLAKLTQGKTQAQLDVMRDDLLQGYLTAHRRIFVFSQSASFRPVSWRGINTRIFESKLIETSTDPIALPRNNPWARFGLAQPGRNRIPTTMPKATWAIHEIILKPVPPKPAPTTRPIR